MRLRKFLASVVLYFEMNKAYKPIFSGNITFI
jgi:hypothetical protein